MADCSDRAARVVAKQLDRNEVDAAAAKLAECWMAYTSRVDATTAGAAAGNVEQPRFSRFAHKVKEFERRGTGADLTLQYNRSQRSVYIDSFEIR
ncbi:MAG TPA: hypothetical protein V6D08_07735 [Candidatus Obscuribacterales bacterium]